MSIRNVRNYWITTTADGIATRQATGPRAKDGGFSTTIQMRDHGAVTTALEVQGYAQSDGTLRLQIVDGLGTVLYKFETKR